MGLLAFFMSIISYQEKQKEIFGNMVISNISILSIAGKFQINIKY